MRGRREAMATAGAWQSSGWSPFRWGLLQWCLRSLPTLKKCHKFFTFIDEERASGSPMFMKMKLLFVHERFGALAGAEANILATADGFRQRGHAVGLLHGMPTGICQGAWE